MKDFHSWVADMAGTIEDGSYINHKEKEEKTDFMQGRDNLTKDTETKWDLLYKWEDEGGLIHVADD
jgi:hypothetical protein